MTILTAVLLLKRRLLNIAKSPVLRAGGNVKNNKNKQTKKNRHTQIYTKKYMNE